MSVFVVFIPFIILAYLKRRRLYLYQRNLKDRIGVLYSGIHLFRDRMNLYYFPIFLFRRFWFVAIATLLYDYPFAQLQVLVFMSSLYIMFYGSSRPHESRFRVRMEIFNECMIMLLNYHMLLFSGFPLARDYNYYFGYTFVFTAAVMTFVNLGFMINGNIKRHRLRVRLTQRKEIKKAKNISNQGSFLKSLMKQQKDELKI